MYMEVRNKLISEKDKIVEQILNPKKLEISLDKIIPRNTNDHGRDQLNDYLYDIYKDKIDDEMKEDIDRFFRKASSLNANDMQKLYEFQKNEISDEAPINKKIKADLNNFKDKENIKRNYKNALYFLLTTILSNTANELENQKSLTDSIQVLLFLEIQTNNNLNNLEKEYIYEIQKSLLDETLNTNNLLMENINKINDGEKFKETNFDLKNNISKLCQLDYFKSDHERFLGIKRTKENDKLYKKKDSFGFIRMINLGIGKSGPQIFIKRILQPSKKISKKYEAILIRKNIEIIRNDMKSQLYRSELMKYISPEEYAKTREVDKNIMIKALPDFASYADNPKINSDQRLVNQILLIYMLKIGDRHNNNISSDLKNIDLSEAVQQYPNAEQMKTTLDNIGNCEHLVEFQNYLKGYIEKTPYPDELKNQFYNVDPTSFKKYFIEFCQNLKEKVDANRENIGKLLTEYQNDTKNNLLFSEKGFEFLNSMPLLQKHEKAI